MRARLMTFAAAVSLLVFLAVVALLVLSIVRPTQVVRGAGPDSLILYSSGGELSIARGHYDPVGNAVYIDRPGDAWHVQYIYPAALAAVLPLAWLLHRQRERSPRRRRKCVNCGHPLRASEESCPGCGHVPAEK